MGNALRVDLIGTRTANTRASAASWMSERQASGIS